MQFDDIFRKFSFLSVYSTSIFLTELDYTWTGADDVLSNSSDSERGVTPDIHTGPNGPPDAGTSSNQLPSMGIESISNI